MLKFIKENVRVIDPQDKLEGDFEDRSLTLQELREEMLQRNGALPTAFADDLNFMLHERLLDKIKRLPE